MEGLAQIIIKIEDERGVRIATYDSRVEGSPLNAAAKARAHLDRKWPAPKKKAPAKKAAPKKTATKTPAKKVAKKAKKVVRKLKRR